MGWNFDSIGGWLTAVIDPLAVWYHSLWKELSVDDESTS